MSGEIGPLTGKLSDALQLARLLADVLKNGGAHDTTRGHADMLAGMVNDAMVDAMTLEETSERSRDNLRVLCQGWAPMMLLLKDAAELLRAAGIEHEGPQPCAACQAVSLVERIEAVLKGEEDPRERAKKSWDNWTDEDIETELKAWRNLV